MSTIAADTSSLKKRRLSTIAKPNKKLKDDENSNINNRNTDHLIDDDDDDFIVQNNNNSKSNNSNNNNNNLVKRRKSILPQQQQQKVTRFAQDVLEKENQKENQQQQQQENDNEDYYNDLENLFNTTTTTQQQQQLAAAPKLKRKSIVPSDITLPSSIPTAHKSSLPSLSKPINQPLNNIQISEVYKNIIKLNSENKITTKNTWGLNLIDYIDDVIETNNFQEASCTLDASVQIYATRVDSIHTDTYKYLGGLNRVEDNDDDDDDDDSNNNNDDPNNEQAKKSREKRKKRIDVNTLEHNHENITLKTIDLAFTVDPLFKKTSSAFDEGGVKGLLLNHLSVYGNCRLVFDSNDSINEKISNTDNNDIILSSNGGGSSGVTNSQQEGSSSTIDISSWSHLFTYNREKVCPTLHGFNNWSIKSIDVDGNSVNADDNDDDDEFHQSDDDEIQQFYDSNGKINLDNNTDEFVNSGNNNNGGGNIDFDDLPGIGDGGYDDRDDDNFQPFPQNYDDDDDHFGDGGPRDYDDDINHNQQQISKQQAIVPIDNQDWEEFDFFGPGVVTENWTGPEHWKFKSKKKQTTTTTTDEHEDDDENDKPNKRKKTSKAVYLDFDAPPPPESLFEPGKNTTLTNAALKKAAESSTILPPDIHYDIKNLSRLFNKPKCTIPPMSKRDTVFRRRTTISSSNTYNNNNTQESANDNSLDFGDDVRLISNDHDLPFSQTNDDDRNYGGGYDDDDDGYGDAGPVYDPTEDGPINQPNLTTITTSTTITTASVTLGIGGQMVDEPRKVDKLDIKYVKVPKKFDVKSFKQNVWNILEKEKQNDSTISSTISPSKQQQSNNDDLIITSSTNDEKPEFSNLLKQLEEKQDKKEELSVGLAFMCLLDLANEKNLILAQTGIDNLFISTK